MWCRMAQIQIRKADGIRGAGGWRHAFAAFLRMPFRLVFPHNSACRDMIGKPVERIDAELSILQQDFEHVGAEDDTRFVLLMCGDVVRHEFFKLGDGQACVRIVSFRLALRYQQRADGFVCVPKIHC